MTAPLHIYVPEPLSGVSLAQPFWFKYPEKAGTLFFTDRLPESFFEKGVTFSQLSEAQAIVLPHNFVADTEIIQRYIHEYADKAEDHHIPLFLFSGGDFSDELQFDPRAYIFRQSVYRSTLTPQVIVTPTLAADGGEEGFRLRKKTPVPIVSFCGQTGYQTVRQWVSYTLKLVRYSLLSLVRPLAKARMLGVYFRRKMIAACENSDRIRTRFIKRPSFSGASRTISLEREQARKEFIDSIIESDFVLSPKGDGNYSNRFLETLSFGRIPVVADTDIVLPLEREIEYEKIIVRVPMDEIAKTPEYIRDWYDSLSEEEWHKRQQLARTVFVTQLRFDTFFDYFFKEVMPTLPRDPRERTI